MLKKALVQDLRNNRPLLQHPVCQHVLVDRAHLLRDPALPSHTALLCDVSVA